MHADAIQMRDIEEAGINAVVATTNLIGLKQHIESLLGADAADHRCSLLRAGRAGRKLHYGRNQLSSETYLIEQLYRAEALGQ